MMSTLTRLVLVVPCYNEAARLNSDAFLQLVAARRDVDVLFVDDGSTDATRAVLDDIVARSGGRAEAMALPRNQGKAAAVQRGVLSAFERQSEFVGYWDADLATPLDALQDFIDVLDTNPRVEIVMGARVKLLGRRIERYATRHYFGRAFATAASLTLQLAVYDTQCGAKVLRASRSVQRAFLEPFRTRWVFDVELLARYIAITGRSDIESRIYELPLRTWIDIPGSKVTPWHALRALWDLAQIRRRSGLPSDP
jgi:glycosyltransferase involved in cell wall biosynthesis